MGVSTIRDSGNRGAPSSHPSGWPPTGRTCRTPPPGPAWSRARSAQVLPPTWPQTASLLHFLTAVGPLKVSTFTPRKVCNNSTRLPETHHGSRLWSLTSRVWPFNLASKSREQSLNQATTLSNPDVYIRTIRFLEGVSSPSDDANLDSGERRRSQKADGEGADFRLEVL